MTGHAPERGRTGRTWRLALLAIVLTVAAGATPLGPPPGTAGPASADALATAPALTGQTSRRPGVLAVDARTALRRPSVAADDLPGRAGVRLVRVAVSGGGGLVDLRFQVLDPAKAQALHDAATPPILVDETSGVIVKDLYMGHSHTGPYKAAVTYYLVFINPGNWIRRGTKVTVLLGATQVPHVPVS
ncbi:hypothetical protein Skr01_54900 [Sphaerisporangium krabiense]|uniref:Uncharacterized protein n=1 Tax=Sphaerisporangium krabiense TaxID=763782 RepID=A0A7W8ZBL4_9ACTN|nr:hypothetical protein [Sphaerisporangium krabiense]MBB5630911.1 hypothetical protein [Sphaerisporangium krabiense]GII65405.1 hypothetical protein Skr01_54900 [Sphaerisporangium krabiense]